MIHLSFVYKGAVVQQQSFDMLYNGDNYMSIVGKFVTGEIEKPENWDRYYITDKPLPDWVG